MNEYKFVLSSNKIAQQMVDLLENLGVYSPSFRAQIISQIEKSLNSHEPQDKEDVKRTLRSAALLHEPEATQDICEYIDSFVRQKELINEKYVLKPHKPPRYKMDYERCDEPKKIITQEMYDSAVTKGFPKDFFKNAILDSITIYCLPENADFTNSVLSDCYINVCAAREAVFDNVNVYDSEFNTVDLSGARITESSSFVHTHFRYCDFSEAQLSGRMHMCNVTHGRMDNTDLFCLHMNRGNFRDIKTSGIQNLDTVSFTAGAMTEEEVKRYQARNFDALQPHPSPVRRQHKSAQLHER